MKQFLFVVAVMVAAAHFLHAQPLAENEGDLREYPLPEVEVMSIKTKTRTIGRMSNKGSIVLEIEGANGEGKEMGLQFKTKKRAWIKRVSFAIVENDSMLVRMPFRLNLYKKQGNECTDNLVSSAEFIYDKEAIIDGRFAYTLPIPWAIDRGEYVVAIEFLENFPNHKYVMRTGIMTGTTYKRDSTLVPWSKIPLGSTLAIEILEEK